MKPLILLVALGALLGAARAPGQEAAKPEAVVRAGTFAVRGTEVAVELGEFTVPAKRTAPSGA